MAYDPGEVWWGPAPHKAGPAYRPWIIVSGTAHPFSHTESILLAMTTQRHSDGIPVPDDAWVRGGSKKDSYISPWYVATVKHRDLDRQQGELERWFLAEVIEDLHRYTSVSDR